MESLLSKIIVEPDANLLILLKICLVGTLVIYIPFLAMSFGALILSIYHGLMGYGDSDSVHHEVSREIMLRLFPERHYGILYGVFPLFTIMVVYAQSLYGAKISVVSFFAASVFFAFLGYYFLYKYRHALEFSDFLSSIQETVEQPSSKLKEYLSGYEGRNAYLHLLSGGLALFFVSLAIYQLVGAMDTVLHTADWASTTSSFYFFASPSFWLKSCLVILTCFSMAGAGILCFLCRDNESLSDEAFVVAKTTASFTGLYATMLLPLFGFFYHWSLPGEAYSYAIICYAGTALFFLLLASARMASAAHSAERRTGSTTAFIFTVLALVFVSVSDNTARENATEEHTHSILSGSAHGADHGGGH
jgi:hypothetical protein